MGRVRSLLNDRKVVIGSWINSASPIVAELLAQAGFDFLCIDIEHSAVDLPQAQQLFQAIRSGNQSCDSFVRLPGVDYSLTKRFVDAGADGVVAPLIRTEEEVNALVAAVKYPPLGLRGVGFCRGNDYGIEVKKHFDKDNDGVVVVQIEHIEAVENIDAILGARAVDVAFLGPYDLSASMGIPGQFDHPSFCSVAEKILKACHRHNVVPGIHVVNPETELVSRRLSEGYRFIAYSLDITFLTHHSRKDLGEIRALL